MPNGAFWQPTSNESPDDSRVPWILTSRFASARLGAHDVPEMVPMSCPKCRKACRTSADRIFRRADLSRSTDERQTVFPRVPDACRRRAGKGAGKVVRRCRTVQDPPTNASNTIPIHAKPSPLPFPFPSRSPFPLSGTTLDATIDRSDGPRVNPRPDPPLKSQPCAKSSIWCTMHQCHDRPHS